MGNKKTRRNRRTKSRKYRRQRGGDETLLMSSFENKKEESNIFDNVINGVNGVINDVSEWFNKPEWFYSSQETQTAGRRKRKTYKNS
jgi:hypothetical protein